MENVICTHCGSENVNYERTGPHIKATCNTCGRYIKFVKYMPDKDYKTEFLDKEPATDKQKRYIRMLLKTTELGKGTAIKIIELLKGGEGGDITGD